MKNDGTDLDKQEQDLLQSYIDEYDITVEPTESGLYYIEIEEGNGMNASTTDYALITYTGRLINRSVFDCTSEELAKENSIYNENVLYGSMKFNIGSSILGMAEGLSMMQEGDSVQLIIPSELGFGNISAGNIPSYATLIYNIRLQKVISDPDSYEDQLLLNYVATNQISTLPSPSGLYYIEEDAGTGDFPVNEDRIKLIYSVYLLDGRFIESSDGNSVELDFDTDDLLKGLTEGLSLMKEGGKAKLLLPYDLAHGAEGRNASDVKQIPPYSALVFNIELVEILD